MKKKNLILTAVVALIISLCASFVLAQEKMTNDEVIQLTKAGLASSIIVGKINTSPTNFDMSTDALIKLKQAGVSDDVVNAMLVAKNGKAAVNNNTISPSAGDPNDPMSKHSFGIYLYQEKDGQRKMTQLQAKVSSQNRTGGKFTASITPFGLGKVKTKTNLDGRNADLQLQETMPVFYFYLDASTGGLNTASGIPASPSEFSLIRFHVRGDDREVTISKENSWSGKGGLSGEYVVGLKSEDLGNGVFRVTPAVTLTKGEYAFYLLNSGNANTAAGVGSKFFDFGVQMTP
ncbi:MAG: hypothetical protein HS105_08980 [Chloracidobacterium sp.]|nr:hypothetical protein [Chloracidobacterium sp.]MCC6824925.1 hypothetical protein [Acidobacteriota bacterium]MCO5334321.1 hypothetical protein [Pyrinomonadaceae bacterium]